MDCDLKKYKLDGNFAQRRFHREQLRPPHQGDGVAMGLSLGELESGSGAALTVLFPFLHPRIAGEKPLLLQRQPELFFGKGQGFGDAMPNSSGLAGLAPALHAGNDVVAADSIDRRKRLTHVIP